ncbi:MAG: hypothetical protein V7711_16610 [Pseudomonadales bacterium]
MTIVKKTAEYTIYQRRDERYAVKDSKGKAVNGDEKVRILTAEELIKISQPAAPAEAPAEEVAEDTTAEESTAEAGEESAE